MAKTCTYKTCTNPQFGGKMCRIHQWARTDKKTKPIAKRTLKRAVFAPDWGYSSQIQLFRHLYFIAKKPIKCFISGRDITDCVNSPITLFVSHFAHILPKGTYTYWRLNPRNIIMLSPEAHTIVDQGTLKDREKHPEWRWADWDREVEFAKDQYQEYVISNNL